MIAAWYSAKSLCGGDRDEHIHCGGRLLLCNPGRPDSNTAQILDNSIIIIVDEGPRVDTGLTVPAI